MLYACESGSRGWEFPSPDSDYDVRFIYIKPFQAYLSINEKKDHLAFPINDELDIYGWDLRKVLQLIRKSNTTPFEWLQSPIVYKEETGFRDTLWSLCTSYFNQKGNIYHYLGIAKTAWQTTNNDGTIKIKKLFYVLRPLLAALWCTDQVTIAPMSIQPLLSLLANDLKSEITDLIRLKETKEEGFLIRPSDKLSNWINETFTHCSNAPIRLKQHSSNVKPLDDFFIKTIRHDDTRT